MSQKISRRRFLELAGVSISAGLMATRCRNPVTDLPTPNPTATQMPSATPPPMPTPTQRPAAAAPSNCPDGPDERVFSPCMDLEGERYEVQVPDTLDLQERAELAINALTRCTNPAADYDVYFYGDMQRNPPVMYRQMHIFGKFDESLAMMRIMTGSDLNQQVDQRWREVFLHWLVYEEPTALLQGPDMGREFAWLSLIYHIEQDPCLRLIGEQAVDRLMEAAVWEDGYCYLPGEGGLMPTGWEATYEGWTLQGVTQFYLATGYSPAGTLAKGLAYYLKDQAKVFDDEGRFLARHPSDMGPALHFHHNGNALVGISEYAAAVGDSALAAFVQKGYEYASSTGTPLVGYFPEYIDDWPDDRPILDCETCCTADMVLLALTLTEAGQGDYWDDADRYVRNQLVENQMQEGGWIDQFAATQMSMPVGEDETGDRVSERAVGSFSGWATANDYLPAPWQPFVSACCTGNGTRAMYYVWKKMVAFRNGTLVINLLMNRASSWADVDSYIPYEGRVDVMVKQTCGLELRIPEWVQPAEVSCTVDGQPVIPSFQGRYMKISQVQNGSKVSATFPISVRDVEETIGGIPYTLIIKGNDVVSIDPPGTFHPFYQRAHYRSNQARWKTMERFVIDDLSHC
jgi:hypothetical protein